MWLRWLLPERPVAGWRAVLHPMPRPPQLDDDGRPVVPRYPMEDDADG